MEWQLLALWAIVLVTVIWFVRDERRQRADARLARAARYYAHAPKFRHVSRAERVTEQPKPRAGSLLRNDRAFFDQFLTERTRK